MHRPSVLQQSGIDVTKNVSYKGTSHEQPLNDYSKLFTGHQLKKQQVFSSPAPVSKGSLLPAGNGYPYIQISPYVQYMSPQRHHKKANQLLDVADAPYKQIQPPPYK